jgi:hypothetical protein
MSSLDEVRARFTKAGIPTIKVNEEYLHFTCGADTMVVRVMADPGHPDRVHLRTLTSEGEVTVSTQRLNKLKSLIDYALVLRQAAARQI